MEMSPKQIIILGVVTLVALLFLTPLLWMLLTSFRPTSELYSWPFTIIPTKVSLDNYIYVFNKVSGFGRYFLNSSVVTFFTVVIVLISSAMGGYAFAFKDFKGKNILFMSILLILTIPYIMYVIPLYMMEDWTGLQNTWWGLILPYVTINLPWGILIMRGAFSTIPRDIKDSAMIDGCNEFQLWYRVLVPMVKPSIAATTLITFVFSWQEYLFASSLMTKNEWQTLPVGIVWIRDELQTLVYGRISVAIILAIIPILILFLLFRDFFIKGLREGMLKG